MTKIEVLFFLEVYLLRRKDEFKPFIIETISELVEDIVYESSDFDEILDRIRQTSFTSSSGLGIILRSFRLYLITIKKICG